jgi:hypothetical protein
MTGMGQLLPIGDRVLTVRYAPKAALRHAASDSTSIGRLRTCVGGENGFDRFAASKPMLPNQWQR